MKKKAKILNTQNILFLIVICVIFCGCEKINKEQKNLHSDTNSIMLTINSAKSIDQKLSKVEKVITNINFWEDISNNVNSFSTLLNINKGVQNDMLTNITQEIISNVFTSLKDPTHIVLFLEAYINGNFKYRQIAKRFFKYMQENYKEERFQACAKCMLGQLTLREVYNPEVLNIKEDNFDVAIKYFEKVIQLPSKEYYYFPALDGLIYLYRIKGDLNINVRKESYAKGREYAWEQYNDCNESWIKDDMLCTIMELCDSREQAKELLYKYKNRKWSSPERRKNFINSAKICHSIK